MTQAKKSSIDSQQELTFLKFIEVVLTNWGWILFSLVITVGYAIIYLQKTPPVYNRTAMVVITNNFINSTESVLKENEPGNLYYSDNVENEILLFKSNRIMPLVTDRLNLNVMYSTPGFFRDFDLYDETPVRVTFLDAKPADQIMFTLTPTSMQHIVLTMWEGKKKKTKQIHFGDTIATAVGRVVVQHTEYLNKETLSMPVSIVRYNMQDVADIYTQHLQVDPLNKDSKAIAISLNDVCPKRAEDIVNAVIEVYSELMISERKKIGIRTATFLNQRIQEIESELSGVDYNIADYKNKNQHLKEEILVKEKKDLRKKVTDCENQLTLAEYVYDYLTNDTKDFQIIPSNMGIADINIERQIDTYNKLLFQRNKLIYNSSDHNPVIHDLNNSLIAMKRTIVMSTENYISGLTIKWENAIASENMNLKRMAELPMQQKYILTAKRKQMTTEKVYLYLLNKREENSLDLLTSESNIRIIDPAMGSEYPISPRPNFTLLLAVLCGLALPLGTIYLFLVFDTHIKERKDIEQHLSAPFLGEIPYYKGAKEMDLHSTVVVKEDAQSDVSEAFRILRTNLGFLNVQGNKQQVIMITSLRPHAGKTFITWNLGLALALTDKRVVLVDLDIRRGTLSKFMGKDKVGITTYLVGNAVKESDLIYPSGIHPNLDVIVKGPMPPNPAELLLSPLLDKLMAWLREHYDYIILDNVPSNILADARIVNRVADLTLYVIRKGQTDKRVLPDIENLYVNKILKNMAIILNGVDRMHSEYGYYGKKEQS